MERLQRSVSLPLDLDDALVLAMKIDVARLEAAIRKAQNYLLDKQHPDGKWMPCS